MSTFKTTRRELTVEFTVKTSAKLTTFHGTKFVPNRCGARVYDGEIVSLMFDRVDRDGFIEYDTGGPDGAVLSVSFAGDEIDEAGRAGLILPKVVLDARTAVENIAN